MRHLAKVGLITTAVIPIVMLSGCTGGGSGGGSSSGPSGNGPQVEKRDLTVAAVPVADEAGLYIALQRGYFTAEGLHVKVVPIISSETAISEQMKGAYDITAGNYVSYIQAQIAGTADLRIIAEGSLMEQNDQALYVAPGSPITSIADLRHKTVGVNVPDNIGTLLISSVLEDHGMPAKDVDFVPAPFPTLVTDLQKRKIDAAWLPEPFASMAEMSFGAQQLVDLDQGATQNFPIGCYVVTAKWAREYPGTMAAFLRALHEGQEVADTDRAAVEQAMETYTGVKPVIASVMAIDTYPLTMDPTRMQRVVNAMREFGMLGSKFSITTMMGG